MTEEKLLQALYITFSFWSGLDNGDETRLCAYDGKSLDDEAWLRGELKNNLLPFLVEHNTDESEAIYAFLRYAATTGVDLNLERIFRSDYIPFDVPKNQRRFFEIFLDEWNLHMIRLGKLRP